LIYTSGTTGKPKGVMLGEANLLGNLAGINPVFDFTQADCLLLALPLFHAYGFIIALLALRKAASLVLVPKFTPQALMSALTAQPVTVLPMVPTMFSLLLQASQRTGRAPFERIRFCISGGAALPEALLSQLQDKLGLLVLEGYGLSEASPVVAVNRLDRGTIPGSVGLPLPNVSVTLGEDGEILVEGPNVMLGYFHDAEATAAAMTPAGRLRTGDLGHLDAEGNLYLSGGRKKDLIIKAGENISPVKIEQVLYAHPDVLEASVIGVPHARDGESILACIELKPDVPEDARPSVKDLIQHCRQHLPAFLVPDAVTFLDTLPKNAAGKILKKELRARFHS
jgi:long-chain acyl-CoA synthetase